ncbi:ATP-dependent DNA helicase RecG [Oricola cellulosilytica]|uniref:ATP-dependent DNA helicase RecG n=1 Tax=Oricola cellulosilytica TaxID=1429082 RepID=A0A4R0PAG7_9HYPH|nr:ATP-dependent DNA helicase RecG [Oricola cellulosilytica]TCD13187.1 ATP-dependent DNA helicase RecG [Oricola cellulosilytica]
MRPTILDPLFAPVDVLDGIGPRIAASLGNLLPIPDQVDEPRILALAFHLPHAIIDRRKQPGIANAPEGSIVTLKVRIDRHQPPPRGRGNVPYRVFAHDETGEIGFVFFHAKPAWLEKSMPVGEAMIVSGRVEWFNGRPTMVHPDHIVSEANAANLPLVEPVYPLTAGVPPKVLRRAVNTALDRVPDLPEWIDSQVVDRENFLPFKDALSQLHSPRDAADVDLRNPARRRVAYDELLAGQLALGLMRRKMKKTTGRVLRGDGARESRIRDAFGYPLTEAQERSIAEIKADMAKPERMLRLLQGDVGSGKTVVGLAAIATAIEAGTQAALMAPTEILARQHLASIRPLAEAAGLRVEILTGREKGKSRDAILADLRSGAIDVLIGTHALFQENVTFRDLGLAVVDEQHRFGVHQRLLLSSKGQAADMLVMTATPIPRTLVLTAYGDMDVSRLDSKPAGRQPIRTVAVALDRLDEVVERMRNAIEDGRKVYWICPLVEESEDLDVTSVEERFDSLRRKITAPLGLVHGRMSGAEKDAAMNAFKSGETRILVATTVIEVGVDVPDATIMVIEHAERFGLAQLHQLRGRVGRGTDASSCLLLYKEPLAETARARLAIMRETEDGFRIAEEDLRLRGEGEILGTRQSGAPGYRLASIADHADLLEIARDDARLIIEKDPQLTSERGQALRTLLYLFERDAAIRLLRAG